MTASTSPASVAWLELGARAGRIRVDKGGTTHEFPVPIGLCTVAELFRRNPPHESELEAAIDLVEDAVMPLAKVLRGQAVLVAGDALSRRVAIFSTGSDTSQAASLQAVEGQFEQLAMAARRGAWSGGLRMDSSLAAGLLILRELMHHAGFDRIELRETLEDSKPIFK
jgi:exopolyphosphatase/pppGpp-phosphohydrolase